MKRLYDSPVAEIERLRSTIEARMADAEARQREQREQEVRLILSTSRLANQPRDMWPNTRKALRIVDRVFIAFSAVIVGLAIGWMVWGMR